MRVDLAGASSRVPFAGARSEPREAVEATYEGFAGERCRAEPVLPAPVPRLQYPGRHRDQERSAESVSSRRRNWPRSPAGARAPAARSRLAGRFDGCRTGDAAVPPGCGRPPSRLVFRNRRGDSSSTWKMPPAIPRRGDRGGPPGSRAMRFPAHARGSAASRPGWNFAPARFGSATPARSMCPAARTVLPPLLWFDPEQLERHL